MSIKTFMYKNLAYNKHYVLSLNKKAIEVAYSLIFIFCKIVICNVNHKFA